MVKIRGCIIKSHPWFKFYPARWLGDPHLRIVGASARGVLIDLMAIAHDGTPYGYVTNGGVALSVREIAQFTHERVTTVQKVVTKLFEGGRIAKTEGGTFYIPSMVRMAKQHEKHVEDGSLGGNPDLVGEVNLEDNLQDNPKDKAEQEQEKEQEQNPDPERGKGDKQPIIGEQKSTDKTKKKESKKEKKVLDMNGEDMVEYFSNRYLIYNKDGISQKKKGATLLKHLISDIGAESVKKRIDWLFDNWKTFRNDRKIESGSPTIGILCGFSDYIGDKIAGRGGKYDPSKRGSQTEYPDDPFNQEKK